ncbi:P-loop containing nucleoside triphosphate hydrolase protein [Astrocystis sublimbata]|nr:P-loop containing nucleoside triphosphate hydrolase protein [Astrocystis sublimbata]
MAKPTDRSSAPSVASSMTSKSSYGHPSSIGLESSSKVDAILTQGSDFVVVPVKDNRTTQVPKTNLPCLLMEECFQNENIVGRENELQYLDDHLIFTELSPEPQAIQHDSTVEPNCLIAITGLPGVGKTSLVAAFACSRRENYDAVFWVDSSSRDKVRERFTQIAQALNLRNYGTDFDPKSAEEDVKRWLANPVKVLEQTQNIVTPNNARWLLIFDNADDLDVLEGFLPPPGTGSILITTRKTQERFERHMKQLQIRSVQVHIKELAPLPITQGAELIREWTNTHSEIHVERSLEIADVLGGMPLALLQCAQLMLDMEISFQDFIIWYKRASQRPSLVNHMDTVNSVGIPSTIPPRGNLALSWATTRLTPAAMALAETLSFLDPDRVSQAILEKIHLIDANKILQGFPTELSAYYAARKELKIRAYVKLDDQYLRIHRSVQDVFQLYMEKDRRNEALRCVVALLMKHFESPLWSGRSHGVERWAACNPLLHHLSRIVELYDRCSPTDGWEPSLVLAKLLYRCSWIQFEQMNIKPILSLLRLAETICKSIPLGEDSERTLSDIQHTLGAIGTWTNNSEMALQNTDLVLQYWKAHVKRTGVIDRNIAAGYCQYATALMMIGNHSAAEENLTASLQVLAKLEDKELASSHKLMLGYNLWLQGRLYQAEEILRDGLAIREEKFGKFDTYSYKSGAYHAALGNIELSRNNIEKAKRLHGSRLDDALAIWNRESEFHVPERARCMYLRAKVMREMGQEGQQTQTLLDNATMLWETFTRASRVQDRVLKEKDFDEIVMFWAR